MLTVEWSEPYISCDGSVSQYELSVTLPTCDCDSSPDCTVMDGTAVYTLSGRETQHDITVNEAMSLEYGVTIRADTCGNRLNGELNPQHVIYLPGIDYYKCDHCINPSYSINHRVSNIL